MKELLIGFLLVFVYKLVNNISLYLRTKYYYKNYLSQKSSLFPEQVTAVTKLFDAANLSGWYIPVLEPAGYGYVSSSKASVIENMSNKGQDSVSNINELFMHAKGIFKGRIIETFSPLYWIRTLVFLPSHVLSYLGVDGKSIASKILQVVYLIGIVLFTIAVYTSFDLRSPSSQSEVSVSATTAPTEPSTSSKPTETEKPTEPVKATTTPTTQPATTTPTHTTSTAWNPWEDYKRRKAEEQKQSTATNSTQPGFGIVPEPASGTILYGSGYGTSEITVTASDSSSCVVMLKTPEGKIRLAFYVRAGDTATVGVPAVCLYAYFATGDEWCGYGKGKMFGENTSYSKDDTLCDFSQYTYTYTLQHVYDGNFSETPCDEEDFFE